jgi:hypothetical protein
MPKTSGMEQLKFEQMIELIGYFPLSTDFFAWLGGNDLECKIILEKFRDGFYERIVEYYIHNIRVFDGGGKLQLDKISPKFNQIILSEKEFLYQALPELRKMVKKTVSEHQDGSHYTVVSDMYYQGQVCGGCWEIYNLSGLIEVFNQKHLTNCLPQV